MKLLFEFRVAVKPITVDSLAFKLLSVLGFWFYSKTDNSGFFFTIKLLPVYGLYAVKHPYGWSHCSVFLLQ